MNRLVFPAPLIDHLRAAMAATTLETCAIFFTFSALGGRLLAGLGELAPDEAYRVRTEVAAELSPEYVFEAVRRARKVGAGIVFAHSHPHEAHAPAFSQRDGAGEATLEAYLNARLPDRTHAALVVGQQGMAARRLATDETIEVEEIGSRVRVALPASEAGSSAYKEIYDRKVRAFGPAGQHILDCLTVALVGLGGTGSVIALEGFVKPNWRFPAELV